MILCTPPHFHVKFSVSTGNSATRPTRRRPFKNLTARVIGNTGRQRIIWKSIAKLFTKFVGYMLVWQTWQTELPTTVTKRPRLSSQLKKKTMHNGTMTKETSCLTANTRVANLWEYKWRHKLGSQGRGDLTLRFR